MQSQPSFGEPKPNKNKNGIYEVQVTIPKAHHYFNTLFTFMNAILII